MESDQELFLKWLTRFWCLLLLPWLVLAPLSGMVFVAAKNVVAYVFVGCVWAYPIVLAVSFLFETKVAIRGGVPPVIEHRPSACLGSNPRRRSRFSPLRPQMANRR